MSESHFLWPQGSAVRAITRSFRLDPVTSVEARLASMFYGGHPVLCSSGRSAIVLALIGSGLSRADTVNVFPYANHCVLDAVSRIATPSAGSVTAQARVRIFFTSGVMCRGMIFRPMTLRTVLILLPSLGAGYSPVEGHSRSGRSPKFLERWVEGSCGAKAPRLPIE